MLIDKAFTNHNRKAPRAPKARESGPPWIKQSSYLYVQFCDRPSNCSRKFDFLLLVSLSETANILVLNAITYETEIWYLEETYDANFDYGIKMLIN